MHIINVIYFRKSSQQEMYFGSLLLFTIQLTCIQIRFSQTKHRVSMRSLIGCPKHTHYLILLAVNRNNYSRVWESNNFVIPCLYSNPDLRTLPPELGNLTDCWQLKLNKLNLTNLPKRARPGKSFMCKVAWCSKQSDNMQINVSFGLSTLAVFIPETDNSLRKN